VDQCDTCKRAKAVSARPAGLLQPLQLPDMIWKDIAMDFITGLPSSAGRNCILVVVDRLSKYGHFIALRHPFTAATIADTFAKEIVRLHGVPSSIVSDRDRIFMSSFWKELFRLQRTSLCTSTAYHPQSDGQSEVLNRCLETYLRCFCGEQPKQWGTWLHWAEYNYNTSFHSAIKMTPFEAVYGRPPPTLVPYQLHKATNDGVDNYLRSRDTIMRDLRLHLARAQNRMKVQADKKRREKEFATGDRVYLKLQPYRQSSLAERRFHKLRHKYYGPYRIDERIGPVAYRLDLPDDAKIHDVFHISQLKDGNSVPHTVAPSLPPFSAEGELQFKPSKVLKRRTIRARGQNHLQVLVAWEGLPDSEATWEDYETFHDTFHLEDKLALKGGGNDSSRTGRGVAWQGREPGQAMEQQADDTQRAEQPNSRTAERPNKANKEHKEQQARTGRDAARQGREQGQDAERQAQPTAEVSRPRTRAQARAERAAAVGQAQADAGQA
jgi:hypothetical protein